MQSTARANRYHIALYGKRNSGKSSLINAITDQPIALVSPVPGTTTDPVYKSMEVPSVGAVVFIDTAGLDDEGELGAQRVERTRRTLEKADLALILFHDEDCAMEVALWNEIREKGIPCIAVLSKCDALHDPAKHKERLETVLKSPVYPVSSVHKDGLNDLLEAIARSGHQEERSLLGNGLQAGSLVLLVMPQDIQAPKGRLILPQVQTLRELLDKHCINVCVPLDRLEDALAALQRPPDLIITDSQIFPEVYAKTPPASKLTSFSVLFAGIKGDIDVFMQGARHIAKLNSRSRILIAEACAHSPKTEDIGRVQIPKLLRQRLGERVEMDFVRGIDWPDNLEDYDLIIHCGACMFNRSAVLRRITKAVSADVPITNYGLTLAALSGILDQISFTGETKE